MTYFGLSLQLLKSTRITVRSSEVQILRATFLAPFRLVQTDLSLEIEINGTVGL